MLNHQESLLKEKQDHLLRVGRPKVVLRTLKKRKIFGATPVVKEEAFPMQEFLAKNLSIHFYCHQRSSALCVLHYSIVWESEGSCYRVNLQY